MAKGKGKGGKGKKGAKKSAHKKPKGAKHSPKKAKKLTKAQRSARQAARTRKANKLAKSAAAKKAAATRKRRNKGGLTKKQRAACEPRKGGKKSKKKSPKKPRKAPCTPKIAAKRANKKRSDIESKLKRLESAAIKKQGAHNEEIRKLKEKLSKAPPAQLAAEKERGKKGKKSKAGKHKIRPNPITGWGEGVSAVLGGLTGLLVGLFGDRAGVTHALTAGNDKPDVGQLYNADAANAPIWSSWKRIAIASANIAVPLAGSVLAKRHAKTQSYLQVWAIVAGFFTVGKVTVDLAAKTLGKTQMGARYFAPEITAANALAVAKASTVAFTPYPLNAGGTGPQAAGQAMAGSQPNAGGTMLGARQEVAQTGACCGGCAAGKECESGCTDHGKHHHQPMSPIPPGHHMGGLPFQAPGDGTGGAPSSGVDNPPAGLGQVDTGADTLTPMVGAPVKYDPYAGFDADKPEAAE